MSVHEHINNQIWNLYCESNESVSNKSVSLDDILNSKTRDEMENFIAKDSEWSYNYAEDVLEGPFPKGEDAIAESVKWSYFYAKYVLKGPFPKGENAIAKDSELSYLYAKDVLNSPFPKGEDAISKDSGYSYLYALNILKGPFSKGEDTIKKSNHLWNLYQRFLEDPSTLNKKNPFIGVVHRDKK